MASLAKVFLPGILIFTSVLVIGVPLNKTIRRAKFMGFPDDEMLQDVFDGFEDPLSVSGDINKNSRINYTETTEKTSAVFTLKTKVPARKSNSENKFTNEEFIVPLKTNYTFSVAVPHGNKVEFFTNPSNQFVYPVKPVKSSTENAIVMYEEPEYSQNNAVEMQQCTGNRTEELKIFWNSLGDAVEKIPFLPLEVNVPDMFAAMIRIMVAYLPFMNRVFNQNHPRDPLKTKNRLREPLIKYYEVPSFDDSEVEDVAGRREYRVRSEGSRKRRKNKKRSQEKRNAGQKNSSKKIFQVPGFTKKTTIAPVEDTKLWHSLGNDQKETVKLKNMPITRKKIRLADREVFSFKNSDISNSPIMILNVPQRPIAHYKIVHQETSDSKVPLINDKSQPRKRMTESRAQKVISKPKRKLKTISPKTNKEKKRNSSKRSGRSQTLENERNQANETVTVP